MDIRFQSLYDSFKEISNKINNSSHDELSSVTSINNSSNDQVSPLDLWCNGLMV
jgi:fructose-1,6-bisphosphatase